MKVLLVDDHSLFREAVALLLEMRLQVPAVLQAGHIAGALQVLREHPDVHLVLLDLALPDSDGTPGIARLREAVPHLRIVVVSADDREPTILAALDHGAAGFVPKTANAAALESALRDVFDGRIALPVHMLHDESSGAPLSRPPPLLDAGSAADTLGLSPRQLDVLRLLIEGKPNKLIERELDLSASTVKTHLAAIFRRLEVSSRTQAVVAAARLGLSFGAPGRAGASHRD